MDEDIPPARSLEVEVLLPQHQQPAQEIMVGVDDFLVAEVRGLRGLDGYRGQGSDCEHD